MFSSHTVTVEHRGRFTVAPVASIEDAFQLGHLHTSERQNPTTAKQDVWSVASRGLRASAQFSVGALAFKPLLDVVSNGGASSLKMLVAGGLAAFGAGAIAYAPKLARELYQDLQSAARYSVGWTERMAPVNGALRFQLNYLYQWSLIVPATLAGGYAVGHPWIGAAIAAIGAGFGTVAAVKATRILGDSRRALDVGIEHQVEYRERQAAGQP